MINGPLAAQTEDMLVGDPVYLGVVSTSSLLSRDKSPSSLVSGTARMRVCDSRAPFGGSVPRQVSAVQRQSSCAFAASQVPPAPNHRYTNAACLGVACPELLQLHSGVAYSAALQSLSDMHKNSIRAVWVTMG